MKASTIVKIVIFILLLVAAHALLGVACGKVQKEYQALFSLEKPMLTLAIWVFGSILLVVLAGDLVATLVRPTWIIVLGYFLSALVMFLMWNISFFSALASLIYFLLAVGFNLTISEELKARVAFSIRPIEQGQKFLLFGLVLMLSISFVQGYVADVRQNGQLIPEMYKQKISDALMRSVVTEIDKQAILDPIEKTMALQQLQQVMTDFWNEVDKAAQPYALYIPLMVGAVVFWLFQTFLSLLSWLPPLILGILLSMQKAFGVTKEVVETKEVRRLVLG
jgi:hypothetical protein